MSIATTTILVFMGLAVWRGWISRGSAFIGFCLGAVFAATLIGSTLAHGTEQVAGGVGNAAVTFAHSLQKAAKDK